MCAVIEVIAKHLMVVPNVYNPATSLVSSGVQISIDVSHNIDARAVSRGCSMNRFGMPWAKCNAIDLTSPALGGDNASTARTDFMCSESSLLLRDTARYNIRSASLRMVVWTRARAGRSCGRLNTNITKSTSGGSCMVVRSAAAVGSRRD